MGDKNNMPKNKLVDNSDKTYPDYQIYPASEAIYNKEKEETEIDPEDIYKTKTSNSND
ncbi:hypothetical protein [Flavobacterium sp.]|uniref:hypothetical protein n=1 Tax=Flavobacterium sp. TaxID=239 RepID=UPI0025D424DC|nr:hypothetical protein [Flavobacterium sp.]